MPPRVLYSAYLGGSDDDFGYGIAVDPTGNAYIVGQTLSTNFPTSMPANHAQRHERRFPGQNHVDGAAAGDLSPIREPVSQTNAVGSTVNLQRLSNRQ